MNKQENRYDFEPIGQAIKEARTNQGITREQLAEQLGIAIRNLAQIENKGQHPRFQYLYELVTMFNISVDEYFYPASQMPLSTMHRPLDRLSDRELAIVKATITGIHNAREMGDD